MLVLQVLNPSFVNLRIFPQIPSSNSKKIKSYLYSLGTFLFLCVVLAVHIYVVYRPAPDATTRVMARIDIKQPINQDDVNKISVWLAHQKGVDHYLVNPQTRIVIFTFFPIKTTGDQIAGNFKASLPYKAERVMPSAENLKSSCPVAMTSFSYKVYKLISNII
jgi:hypothetical protein